MCIEVIVHKQVPVAEFRNLLYRFYQVKTQQDEMNMEDGEVEIRVTKRPSVTPGAEKSDEDEVEEDE